MARGFMDGLCREAWTVQGTGCFCMFTSLKEGKDLKNLKKDGRKWWQPLVLPTIMFGLLIWFLVAGAGYFQRMNGEQGLALARQAIRKAVLQCYAVEGMYPADLSYLEEHYNLRIDEEKYRVGYDCFASNIMPEIYVFER